VPIVAEHFERKVAAQWTAAVRFTAIYPPCPAAAAPGPPAGLRHGGGAAARRHRRHRGNPGQGAGGGFRSGHERVRSRTGRRALRAGSPGGPSGRRLPAAAAPPVPPPPGCPPAAAPPCRRRFPPGLTGGRRGRPPGNGA